MCARVLLEDPYRTLGVGCDADEKEIKAAYRRLALKYHPDVNQTHDAERRFVSIQNAYEVLSGKRQEASGVHTRNQHNSWEFQDWFWSFSASRRWSAQHHARPPTDQQRAPQERTVLHTQLAGLRQRAAIRGTSKRRTEAEGAAAAAGAGAGAGDEQQQQQQHDGQAQPERRGGQLPDEQLPGQQPRQHAVHAVEYDSTSMSDGVNMANGVGYDPWSAEAAAAARRPAFTATETVKRQVVGQLGGLKRRAAVKRRADADAAAAGARRGSPWDAGVGSEEEDEPCWDV